MKNLRNLLSQYIYPVLPAHLVDLLHTLPDSTLNKIAEIRIRANQPFLLVLATKDLAVSQPDRANGGEAIYRCTAEDVTQTFQLICKNSVYAFEEEVRQGYLTINGGHRVGLAGQATTFDGKVKTIKHISSINIRLARAISGCADQIMPFIMNENGRSIYNTLVISSPRCGKTTILRDLVRQLSTGNPLLGNPGIQIGVVDERSEIAACQNGIPSIDLGPRVDVLDACPKASGMLMLIRSMSPAVVATDELGREEDAAAVREAIHAGVSVIATAHSRTICQLRERPYIGELVKHNYFDRYVLLSDRLGPGTVEEIYDASQEKALFTKANEVKICG
ncbi:stage III sporulation protein AA [Sporomusa aerivorans]|uniref:stage III sporulation protein AA n=1 Tax=Sporomusa aerivorans TaxID=204936 RepID=UPI00352B0AA9